MEWAHSRAERRAEPEVTEFECAPVLEQAVAVAGVFFSCELLGTDLVLNKEEMASAVERFLEEQYSEEPLVAAVLMVHSLNASRDKRQTAIETLAKYLQNVIEKPDEPKFRKIRIANKPFQVRCALPDLHRFASLFLSLASSAQIILNLNLILSPKPKPKPAQDSDLYPPIH